MSKNGKGFEKFLREEAPAKSQFFRAANKSPEEEAAYQAAQRAFELQLARQEATTEVKEKTYTPKGETTPRKYGVRVPKTDVDLTNVPSEQEVEQAFETSRKASLAVDDTKKISPSYWVTQKDFQDAFGRRYDAMSEQDRQDFFGLVGSSKPRRYTEGPAAGQVIPSTRRPDFIPTYQDVDGVKVPETAFGGAPSKEKSQGFGFQAPTAPSQVSGSGVLGGPKVKPDLSDEEYERRRQERISQKAREMLSREPAPAPEPPPAPEPKSLSDLELERMKRDAEEAPAPAPDPVVATLVSEPISLEDLYKAWDPDGKIRAEQEAEFKQKEARENAAELTTGELQKALGYYGKSTSTTPKEPKKGEYLPWFMRMQNQSLPPSPPVEGLPFDRNKPFETSANFSQRPPEGWEKQSVTARPPGVSAEFSSKDLSGTGLYGGVLGQMRFARGQRPSRQEVGVMGPSRSEAELSRMMRDAREAPSAVGPSTFPGIPASMAARLADYVPPPELPPPPAPDPESLSDLELARMKRDAKESEPSGLSQAMGLAKGVGQFAKNLDQAAGRKIRETGQKVSDIAKRFRTQRDENFRKNIERLEAKGIKVPGFDVGEKGFGQHGNYPAQGSEDLQGQILSKSLVDLPLGPDETIEDRRKEIVQYYKEKMLPSEYAKTWGFASDEPSPELPGRFDMDPIRSKTPVTTQSFNAPQKRSSTAAPEQVASAISANQRKQFAQSSPISQEIASRMLSVQTPGQVSTQLTGRPLTTQERDRFKFDSAVPASVAASMNKVTPVRTPLGQEPLTQTEKPIAGGKKGEREMASFTKGMTDAEINSEFEKLFGKETKNLSIEMKKDMIERFRLGELMQDGGGIMGMNPMYEMEIDPDTGELKLNPKKKG